MVDIKLALEKMLQTNLYGSMFSQEEIDQSISASDEPKTDIQ